MGETSEKFLPSGMKIRDDAIGDDIRRLSRMKLRQKYLPEYGSWKNAKSRAKDSGCGFDKRFEEFPAFLNVMGAKGASENSLDRIDPFGPYSPENCRWLGPQGQSENRRNVIPVVFNGISKTIAKWAEETGQHPSTLSKRRKRGLSGADMIHCKRGETQLTLKELESPWPSDRSEAWTKTYLDRRKEDEAPCEFYYRFSRDKEVQIGLSILDYGNSLADVPEPLRSKIAPELEKWTRYREDAAIKSRAWFEIKEALRQKKEMRKITEAVRRDAAAAREQSGLD